MSVCARCHQALSSVARFCPACGLAVAGAAGARGSSADIAKPPSGAPTARGVAPELGHASGAPTANAPAGAEVDPLATTAPADPAALAALRRGEDPRKPRRGGTKPIAARGSSPDLPQSAAHGSPPDPALAHGSSPDLSRSRGVARTVPDSATLPSAGSGAISPKAVSAMVPSQPPAAMPPAAPSPEHGASPPPPPPSPAGSPPSPGRRVLVEWANGQRYAGTVQQSAPGQCLVLFADGQSIWVDVRRVSVAP